VLNHSLFLERKKDFLESSKRFAELERIMQKEHEKKYKLELSYVCRTYADAIKVLSKLNNSQDEEGYKDLITIIISKSKRKLNVKKWDFFIEDIKKEFAAR
jgi:hypothetical protein